MIIAEYSDLGYDCNILDGQQGYYPPLSSH